MKNNGEHFFKMATVPMSKCRRRYVPVVAFDTARARKDFDICRYFLTFPFTLTATPGCTFSTRPIHPHRSHEYSGYEYAA